MRIILDNLPLYFEGIRTTVVLSVVSYALAFVVGVIVAACRVSPVPPLRLVGTTFVEVLRNIPLTVWMLVFFFGFPIIGIRLDRFPSAVVVLGLYHAAFVGEAVRSGVNSVAAGQAEAARAIGLTFPQVLLTIVLPQALRTVVAPLGSIWIALVKNSSVASLIFVTELSERADQLNNEVAQPLAVFAGAAVAYLLITYPSGIAAGALERRLAVRR